MITISTQAEAQMLECPADSLELAGRRELILAVLAETQVVGERVFDCLQPVARTPARTLLSLLTYCYARDIIASEEIEWACKEDAGARYLCAGILFLRENIREFRRANRPWIEESLAEVLMSQAATADAEAPAVARRKLELAVMMDAMCD
jgi:hypothetical protein